MTCCLAWYLFQDLFLLCLKVASTSDSPGAIGTIDTPRADDDTLDPCDFDGLDTNVNYRVYFH